VADVFISYKRDKRQAVEKIATELRKLGLTVWFDAGLSAGESFSDEIDREARAAKAVLVCWSPASRDSRWVKAEAMIGFEQDKLVAVQVGGRGVIAPPAPFNASHTENLRGWLAKPDEAHPGWKSVLRRIGRLCGRQDLAAGELDAASGDAARVDAAREHARQEAAEADEERKLAAILAVDMVGYSAAAERDQVGAARGVAKLRARVVELAGEHGGRLFHSAGDGFMVEFPLASEAVRAALALLAETAAPESGLPPVRAGAHLGEVMVDGDDLMGHGVNVAARLAAQAEPNGLVISDALKSQLHGEVEAEFAPCGRVRLKKMRETVLAFEHLPGASVARRQWRRWRKPWAMAQQRWRLMSVGAVLAGAMLAVAWSATRLPHYEFDDLDILPVRGGSSTISPDGQIVVYTARADAGEGADSDLFAHDLASGQETQLTGVRDLLEYAPAFSPDGRRLAHVRTVPRRLQRGGERCKIMVRTFPDGLDRLAGECEGAPATLFLSWTPDGRSLVYSDVIGGGHGGRSVVQILDLETGRARNLVPPAEDGADDYNAVVSPDGRRVAFTRYTASGSGDVYVYDLRRNRLTRITTTEGLTAAAWADRQRLFVLQSEGQVTELWLRRADGGASARREMLLFHDVRRPIVGPGVLVFRVDQSATQLHEFGPAGGSPLRRGDAIEGSPAFSSAGALAFISDGWLLLRASGGEPHRFVELAGRQPRGLAWSPDDRRLAYVANEEGRASVFIVDAGSGVISPLRRTTSDGDLASPAWSADGRSLVYAAGDARGVRLMRASADADAPPAPVSDYGWVAAMETAEGLFARHLTEPGIWRLAPGRAPQQVFAEPRQVQLYWRGSWRDWTVAGGRFYIADVSTPGRMRILSRPIRGGAATRVVDIEQDYAGSLAVNARNGNVVYGVSGDTRPHVGLLRFRRR